MRPLVFLLLNVFLSTSLFVWHYCLASDKPEGSSFPADIDKPVEDILASKYPYESPLGPGMAKGYRILFKKVGPDGIRALQAHPHDGIAIQAAWEQVALTVPEKEPPRAVRPDSNKPMRPDCNNLNWFLGFLEGRARVKAPQWWSEALLDSRANRRDNIYPGKPKERPYHKLGLDFTQGPHDSSLKREGNKIILRIGKESVSIPEDLLQKSDHGQVSCNVSALMTPSRCFVAVHEDVGYPCHLACIERETGKVLWKSEVFGTWWGGATGIHHMWVAVTEQNKRIVLFGCASTGLHVEAFRPEDGTNLFRFSTSY